MKKLISQSCNTVKIMTLMTAISVFMANAAWSESYIVGANTKKVRIYNDDFEEIDMIKKKKFAQNLIEQEIGGETQKAIKVIEEDKEEAMLKIELPNYDQPVWVESIAMEMLQREQIICPEAVVARESSSQAGVTIGFGDSCVSAK